MEPKDFQKRTAEHIVELFTEKGQNHVLLADEVGLGKTVVAKTVVNGVAAYHRDVLHDDFFKVIYVCSNANIAMQNYKKLGIENCKSISEGRLSVQHLEVYKAEDIGHPDQILVPMTPSTSFDLKNGQGLKSERAMAYALLSKVKELDLYQKRLKDLLKVNRELQGWESEVKDAQDKITDGEKCYLSKECNDRYIREMCEAIEQYWQENQDVYNRLLDALKGEWNLFQNRSKTIGIVNDIRFMFANISLDKLKPDLVIMDEFQRFKDLITGEVSENASDTTLLANKFLRDKGIKVLLLSATPYKPYITLEEMKINKENHQQEFQEVIRFLVNNTDKENQFKVAWKDYSYQLSEIGNGSFTTLIAAKNSVENELYSCVSRTERFEDNMMDVAMACEMDDISIGDIQSYLDIENVTEKLGLGRFPTEYVKSAPYLLSFMEYKIKKRIRKKLRTNKKIMGEIQHSNTLLLSYNRINKYKELNPNNGRLQVLVNDVFGRDREKNIQYLEWIPASRPYYVPDLSTKAGIVFHENKGVSKTLIFSSWEMVPRMIAATISYEAERTVVAEGQKKGLLKNRFYFSSEDGNEEKRKRTKRSLVDAREEVFLYVSPFLSSLYSPIEMMDRNLDEIRTQIAERIKEKIRYLRDNGYDFEEIEHSGAEQIVMLMQALDGIDCKDKLKRVGQSAISFLTKLAIAGPSECAYRILNDADKSREIASKFTTLFNRQSAQDILAVLYGDSGNHYYISVADYCVQGNLQAVLDEFVYFTNSGNAFDTIADAFIQPAITKIDTYSTLLESNDGDRDKRDPRYNMHAYFAVGYYNASTGEKNEKRASSVRAAFNSPFWPFVLATTSIGQEGLDFHGYCRKVMHWNLPSNPIDLEQREGRVNRFLSLALRQTLANDIFSQGPFKSNVWEEILTRSKSQLGAGHSDLVPFWCLPKEYVESHADTVYKIERIVPMYPCSRDVVRYQRLEDVLGLYRMTLGQPRQEETLEIIKRANLNDQQKKELYINLSPYGREDTL